MDAEVADSDSPTSTSSWSSRATSCPATAGVPDGDGRLNIGLGCVNSYKNWQAINATQFLGEFPGTLPPEWKLPSIEELKKNKSVRAWRLPMGFTAWPPWRPEVLFTGDSWARANRRPGGHPKALESGLAAGECAVAALENGGPDDFTNYAQRDGSRVGQEHRRGRYFHKLPVTPQGGRRRIKLIDNARFRDVLPKSMYKKAEGPLHKVL